MTNYDRPLDPMVAPLLEHGRVVPPVPNFVRTRALARARATVATMRTRPLEVMPARRKRTIPITLAASIALAVGAAGAVAALLGRAPQNPEPAPQVHQAVVPPMTAPSLALPPAAPAIAPQCNSAAKPSRPKHSTSAQESYSAELGLLERAQAAYASRDFGLALALVAEHGRRFQNGRLAEEREALRVQSLAGSGRTDEADRAAATFAERFPRSVLLQRLGGESR